MRIFCVVQTGECDPFIQEAQWVEDGKLSTFLSPFVDLFLSIFKFAGLFGGYVFNIFLERSKFAFLPSDVVCVFVDVGVARVR